MCVTPRSILLPMSLQLVLRRDGRLLNTYIVDGSDQILIAAIASDLVGLDDEPVYLSLMRQMVERHMKDVWGISPMFEGYEIQGDLQ